VSEGRPDGSETSGMYMGKTGQKPTEDMPFIFKVFANVLLKKI
jgi:hypothetical protein